MLTQVMTLIFLNLTCNASSGQLQMSKRHTLAFPSRAATSKGVSARAFLILASACFCKIFSWHMILLHLFFNKQEFWFRTDRFPIIRLQPTSMNFKLKHTASKTVTTFPWPCCAERCRGDSLALFTASTVFGSALIKVWNIYCKYKESGFKFLIDYKSQNMLNSLLMIITCITSTCPFHAARCIGKHPRRSFIRAICESTFSKMLTILKKLNLQKTWL